MNGHLEARVARPTAHGDFSGGNYRHVIDAASLPALFNSIKTELLCGDIHITKTPNPAGPVDVGPR